MIRLPTVPTSVAIVDTARKMTVPFSRFLLDFSRAIEANDAAQAQTLTDLSDIVNQLQAQQEAIQAAINAANDAQESADGAAGGTAKSGSNTNPSLFLDGTAWVSGPVVALTGVSAGTLTITGSGPQQDDDVVVSGASKSTLNGEFRIVEIISGVDTVLFTGEFFARKFDGGTTFVSNRSSTAVSGFASSRSSTGSVSYRIDARRTSGADYVSDLLLYIFVRRA